MSLDRRGFMAGLGAGALAGATRSSGQVLRRPNILWISCEDISPHLGCYGDALARTPNLDRLATEGVRYTHAYTNAGVCAPSRSGIMSCCWPPSLGSNNMRCRALLPDFVQGFPTLLREAGYYTTNNVKTDYNFPVPKGAWDESSNKAHWKNRPEGQPFFAVFNYTVCHESGPRLRGEAYAKRSAALPAEHRRSPDEFDNLPPIYADTPESKLDWAQLYELITIMDGQAGARLKEIDEAGLADETIVIWWSDHGDGLPRAKRWLYETGTHVPMIARIPEAFRVNGQGEPGTVDDRMIAMLDLGPTTLNLAGVKVPEFMAGQPFLGPALPPAREYIYGARDRMDERYDLIRMVRDKQFRYLRNWEPWKPYDQWISYAEQGNILKELRRLHEAGQLNADQERLFAAHKPIEELYDAEADPFELHNLAGDPKHADTLARLRAELERWMLDIRDTGLLTEPELVARAPQAGSGWAILHEAGGEVLLQRLMTVADLAARGPEALPKLVEALDDPDAAVRYWAVTGIANQGRDAGQFRFAISQAATDEAPVVRIAAARAMVAMGDVASALAVIEPVLAANSEPVRLHAMLLLDDLGGAAAPLADTIREAAGRKPVDYPARVAQKIVAAL